MKPQRGSMYRCTLSLTLALDGVGGQRHVPAALAPEIVHIYICTFMGIKRIVFNNYY